MTNLVRRYAVAATLTAAFVGAIFTVGNTLAVIQNRQAHEIQAIDCLLDVKCAAAVSHVHGHAPSQRPNPAAVPATTLV
jgi:hypothetical protein